MNMIEIDGNVIVNFDHINSIHKDEDQITIIMRYTDRIYLTYNTAKELDESWENLKKILGTI